jgi:ethanolamine utilization protein EutN
MFIARVRGNVVTSHKVPKMAAKKLLIIEPLQVDEKGKDFKFTGRCFVAVDAIDAGVDDLVLVTQGSSARMTYFTSDAPVDCVVIGIIDTVCVMGQTMYKKGQQ